MMTAEDRIRFAVRFAQLDLDQLRPGDWMNVREDLVAFLAAGPGAASGTGGSLYDRGGLVAIPNRPPREMREEAIKTLQGEVRTLLGSFADDLRGQPGGTQHTLHPIPITAEYTVMPAHGRTRTAGMLFAHGSTRDVVLLVLIQLVIREDASPIRRCPEDGRLFYRVRRQEYCSRTCVNRANKRTWRESQERKRTRGKKGSRR